jgi:hypothetical protein
MSNVDEAVASQARTMAAIELDDGLSYDTKCVVAQLNVMTVGLLAVLKQLAEIQALLKEKL